MKVNKNNDMEKIPVNFRIRKKYMDTFQKACKLTGVTMTSVIESLIFSWLKEFGDMLDQEKEIDKLTGKIQDYSKINEVEDSSE